MCGMYRILQVDVTPRALRSIVGTSHLLVVGFNDAATTEQLASCVREDQMVIDLVRLPESVRKRGQYRGFCW